MKTDDPKFTAHALGDIEDLTPAERAEIEALIESDTHAAAEAAETKKFAARLREELQREKTDPLTAAQRTRVFAATQAGARAKTPKVIPFPRRSLVLSAIAACLIVGLFVWMIQLMMESDRATRQRVIALNQNLSEPTISVEEFSALSPEGIVASAEVGASVPDDRLVMQGAGSFAINSPRIDVVAAKQAAPAQANQILTATAGTVIVPFQTAIADNNAGITLSGAQTYTGATTLSSGTLKDHGASATTSAIGAGNTSGAMQEIEQQWARPYRRFDRPPETPPASANVGNNSGAMQGRMGSGRVLGSDTRYAKQGFVVPSRLDDGRVRRNFDTGIGDFVENRAALILPAPSSADAFDTITDNPFLPVREHPLSTFSTDVDTASYAIVRRFLNEQRLPPKGAVRIEELLNYFPYDYPQPKGDAPFSATMEVAACPWTPAHRLVRIGLKGREIAKDKRPASNLVFLLDVSGSMQPANRLPLLKQSLGLLIDQLGAEDRVAIVVYAGSSGCVLESTHDKAEMRLALGRLEAGGSTNGGSGIQLAYDIAKKNFIKGGVNRVILGTDGDWNVGITNQNDLFDLITQRAKSGVFLTALGFGMGNLKDAMLVKLADKGNGNYGYIDSLLEAKKLLVDQLSGTLVTIAKDVKIQVEFNPAQVSGYRLIGYEKRLLAKEDFNDDKKDAGEIGAGHTVTALYEVVPAGKELPKAATVDALKYQGAERSEVGGQKSEVGDRRSEVGTEGRAGAEAGGVNQKSEISPELLTLKLRYKAPDGDTSKLLEFPLTDTGATWEKSSGDFRFAAAVAGYGMLLRDSSHKGNATWNSVRELAVEGKGSDANGYRVEFISLLEKAQSLMR